MSATKPNAATGVSSTRREERRFDKTIRVGQSGGRLVAVMLTIVIAAAVGFVGTKVISELQNSITDKDLSSTNAENQTVFENATESIGTGFADAMGLTDVVFLVLIAGVVLGAVLGLQRVRR